MSDPARLTRLAAAAVDRLEGLADVAPETLNDPNRGPYVEIVPADVLALCDLAKPADDNDAKLVAALRLGAANATGRAAYVLAAQIVRLAALAGIDPPPRTPASATANVAAKAAKATSRPADSVSGDPAPK